MWYDKLLIQQSHQHVTPSEYFMLLKRNINQPQFLEEYILDTALLSTLL